MRVRRRLPVTTAAPGLQSTKGEAQRPGALVQPGGRPWAPQSAVKGGPPFKVPSCGIATACLVLALASSAACGTAPAAETLTYVLKPQPEQGRLQVELTWQTEGRTVSTLGVSERYGTVADVPALLKDMSFRGGAVQRDKADWTVTHARGATLRCRYAVDAGRRTLDWDATHHPVTTETFFHGIGNAFLLVPVAGGQTPEEYEVLLRWQLPEGWKAACSWGGAGRSLGARLKARDVRQSVYLAGPLVVKTTRVEGAREITVAMLDQFGFKADDFAQMAAEIIAAQCAFMGEADLGPFVVTAAPAGGPATGGAALVSGMGLYRSFALLAPPGCGLTEGVEHVFAHELFHYWNGRLLRAAEPEELVYWFTEGFTDYYALRILHESGRWKAATYAKWVNRHLRQYAANPARNVRNDEIAGRFWKERDTVGEIPYQRGLLLGLRWHRLARDRGVVEGVDRWLKMLVRRARSDEFRVTNETLRETGVEALGGWFAAEFDRYVTAAETAEPPADALAPELVGAVTAVYEYELGFDRERSLKERRVVGLAAGSAASQAGLREGDEVGAWSIPGDPDEEVRLKVRREGKLETISYYPRGKRSELLQFKPAGGSGPP